MRLNVQFFFLAFSTRVAVAIILFTFSPAEMPSATPQPQALQLDLRRVNERNEKVLSIAIHIIFSLPKIGGVVREISSKEHEVPSSLLLKAPHICKYLIPKLSLFPLYYYYYKYVLQCCTIVHVMFCRWVDGILLLLLYSYIIIIHVVHGRFAATAAAAVAADRCSFSLISLWLSSRWFGCCWCDACSSSVC